MALIYTKLAWPNKEKKSKHTVLMERRWRIWTIGIFPERVSYMREQIQLARVGFDLFVGVAKVGGDDHEVRKCANVYVHS